MNKKILLTYCWATYKVKEISKDPHPKGKKKKLKTELEPEEWHILYPKFSIARKANTNQQQLRQDDRAEPETNLLNLRPWIRNKAASGRSIPGPSRRICKSSQKECNFHLCYQDLEKLSLIKIITQQQNMTLSLSVETSLEWPLPKTLDIGMIKYKTENIVYRKHCNK